MRANVMESGSIDGACVADAPGLPTAFFSCGGTAGRSASGPPPPPSPSSSAAARSSEETLPIASALADASPAGTKTLT